MLLDGSDNELEEIATKTSDNFKKDLFKYREGNDGEKTYDFFDDRTIPYLICDALGAINDIPFNFIGPRRDFGKPQEEIDADITESARLMKAKEEKKRCKEHLKEEA